jgi:hypothetical protein
MCRARRRPPARSCGCRGGPGWTAALAPGRRPDPVRSRPRQGPPTAEAPVEAQRWRAKSTRMRVAPGVYDLPRRNRSRGGPAVCSYPHCSRCPQRSACSLGTRRRRGDPVGVSRILICSMVMAVLSAVPEVLASRPAQADRATQTNHATPTGLAALAGPGDIGVRPGLWFGWPLPGFPTVVRAFHPPAFRYGPGHRGIDLAAVAGAPVLAAGTGMVVFAGTVAGRGVVSVDHPGGLRTTYEPVSPTVTAGDEVSRGERIGTVAPGHPGCPVTACLHWGVLRGPQQDGQYLDPLRLLTPGRMRLLPIDGTPDRQRSPGRLGCPGPPGGRESSACGGFQHLAPEP